MVELRAVLTDQCTAVPGVKASDEVAGSIQQFTERVWLPCPGEFCPRFPYGEHRDIRSATSYRRS